MKFLAKRAVASAISLLGPDHPRLLPVAADRRPDPALPADRRHAWKRASSSAELHGLNDPLIVQFGRYVWDLLHLDFGESHPPGPPGDRRGAAGLPLDAACSPLITMVLVIVRGHRHRLAGRLPRRRSLRPHRHLHLADRRLRPGFLDRHRRDRGLLGQPRLAADLGHRHRLALDPADRACCSSGRSG